MPNILDGGNGTALGLLDAARTSYKGIGLSPRARAMTSNYLNQSTSGLNSILSFGIAQNADINSLMQKIKAIRASLPQSQISEDVLPADAEAADNGNAAAGANGTNVDTTA